MKICQIESKDRTIGYPRIHNVVGCDGCEICWRCFPSYKDNKRTFLSFHISQSKDNAGYNYEFTGRSSVFLEEKNLGVLKILNDYLNNFLPNNQGLLRRRRITRYWICWISVEKQPTIAGNLCFACQACYHLDSSNVDVELISYLAQSAAIVSAVNAQAIA
ncbi:hypothetical protein ACTFIW_000938 [Dictyostelium discoideum]